MIMHKVGNLLDCDAQVIAHQVNCQGVMGAGVAKAIKDRYPQAKDAYKQLCDTFMPQDLLGKVCWAVAKDKHIANIFGQLSYGRSKKRYTDYDALRKGFNEVYHFAKENHFSVAVPYQIGCGLGGGEWEVVLEMLEAVFDDAVVCEIWRLK